MRYYENNREGLLPYQSQGLELPEYRDNGESCVECDSKTDETWP